MKNKIYLIFICFTALMLAVIVGVAVNKYDNWRYNTERAKTKQQQAEDRAEFNTKIYKMESKLVWYKEKALRSEELAKENLEKSWQDPEKNDEYDADWMNWIELLPDPQIPDEIITREIERIDSTRITYEGKNFLLEADLFYHYIYKKAEPYFYARWLPSEDRFKPRKKFNGILYIGYDSGAASLSYSPFSWFTLGVLEHVQAVTINGKEEVVFNSLIGGGINF